MAEGTISIGSTTLDTPVGYAPHPEKMETYKRSIRGNLIVNRSVNDEDQPISKYHFEISDVVNSKMLTIKAEIAHIGNLDYIDYLQIVEVLSGDGVDTIFYSQRRMSGSTPVPVVTLGGTAKTVTVTENTNPSAGNVYAKADVSGIETYSFVGGTGYAALEVLTVVQSGASGGTFRIDTVDINGVILTMTRLTKGMNYTIASDLATTVNTGSGTGATISVLTLYNVARFIFGDTPPDTDNNIIIQYEPKYYVHIMDFIYTGRIKDVANYTLICEEV